MTARKLLLLYSFSFLSCIYFSHNTYGQRTQIRGFVAVNTILEDGIFSFGVGEQDLFITSELNDDFTFLGETVFKYSPDSPTHFNVSVERIIINYNYLENHHLLIGKHHTPNIYWNDSYHHGRVFFPTIERPLLFDAYTIPIHTTGIALQGFNLGRLRFGYNLMLGNGIGSNEVTDNDKYKSLTAAVHIKPADNLQLGIAFYNDVISEGVEIPGNKIDERINQQLYTASVAHFGKKFELLAEGTFASNYAKSTGLINSFASYLYGGVRIKEKFIPYFRIDYLEYEDGELYYDNDDTFSILGGLRYEISFLIVAKMEYQHIDRAASGITDQFNMQIAIGF